MSLMIECARLAKRSEGAQGERRTAETPLCVICTARPRFATLSRCKPCLQAQSAEDLKARELVRERAEVKAAAKADAHGLTKRCTCCRETLPVTKFAKHARANDGHRRTCKSCVAEGKQRTIRCETSKAKERVNRTKPERRKANREAVSNWKRRNPEAARAGRLVHRAIKRGVLARPTRCQVHGCRHRGALVAHHANYEHPLVVSFVCRGHRGETLDLVNGLPPEFIAVPPHLVAAE